MMQTREKTRLLLASDMSARCDRALDRAGQLAKAWEAELLVVHALDPSDVQRSERFTVDLPSWRRPEQWQATVERRLTEDLEEEGIPATVQIVEGAPASALLEATVREKPSLVITGIARDEPITRLRLGSTVERLVRQAPAPVLTVRRRARQPYRHVLVASDFSPASQVALLTALQWFGQARLTLFHAYYMPGGLTEGGTVAGDSWREAAQRQCERFLLESGIGAEAAQKLPVLIERGQPEILLPDYVEYEKVDLAIVGTHGRGGMARALLGSTAECLLCSLECDTMVVRST
jgi:nucleotide-binding universal stress UspA family protein